MEQFKFTITGQLPSGKNAIIITRTGKRFPQARFTKWRAKAMQEVQWKQDTITHPISVYVKYYAGDKRRRDVPGIIDALWHLLEKVGVVEDDKLLGGFKESVFFKQDYDKQSPRAEITLKVNHARHSQDIPEKGEVKFNKSDSATKRKSREKIVVARTDSSVD